MYPRSMAGAEFSPMAPAINELDAAGRETIAIAAVADTLSARSRRDFLAGFPLRRACGVTADSAGRLMVVSGFCWGIVWLSLLRLGVSSRGLCLGFPGTVLVAQKGLRGLQTTDRIRLSLPA